MRFLKTVGETLSKGSWIRKRRFAQVHDVQIRVERRSRPETTADNDTADTRESDFEQTGSMERNVFKQPLALHSTRPLTGYMRTGYCEAPRSDAGNHSVAGIVTNEFLDFSAARGNDLRQVGLTEGCKWCLCVARWKEAFEARSGDADRKVPRVVLGATNERALEGVRLEELRRFAVDGEGGGGGSAAGADGSGNGNGNGGGQ